MARIDSKGALRHRTRLTNKSRVIIHHGDLLDAELVAAEEDNEKSKTLNPAGVEKEDASVSATIFRYFSRPCLAFFRTAASP